jgi:hypothetical protein
MISWIFRLALMVGIIMIVVGFLESERQTIPPRIVEYRYIPRTMEEEAKEPASLHEIYSNLWDENILR